MRAYLIVLALAITSTGCSPSSPSTANTSGSNGASSSDQLRGSVAIDGSSTVYPISEWAASQFQKRYPNVSVTVAMSGTGGGFKRFAKGETDISDASRPIKLEELEAARAASVSFVEVPVAYDGLTIVVHPSNDWVDQLTLDELKMIFTAESSAKTWNQVRSEWPNREIVTFAPGTDSGTFDYFKEVVAGDSGELRSDMSTSEDDNVLVKGVAGSPGSIGFFGVAYYEENQGSLKAVPIVNPLTNQAVSPTTQTIESGDYAPFSRPLFIYVNAASLRRPEVKRFLQFYMENAPTMAADTGYVALPESIYARGKANLQDRKTGTHYLTEEGEGRSGPVTEVFTDANLRSI